MFCEVYSQSLTDAAASGKLPLPLRDHLAACEACRGTFAEEQSLYAAIDTNLKDAANAEVPTTLIPRVRVALNNEPTPQRNGLPFLVWSFAGASVAVALVLTFLYLPRKRALSAESPQTATTAATQNSASPPALNPVPPRGVSPVQREKPVVLVASQNSTPELPQVLVPPDEMDALLRYEGFVRRKQGVFVMASAKSVDVPQGIEPLRIPELELGDLKILALAKPLSDGQAK